MPDRFRFVIVSRHPAAVEFIRANAPEFVNAPVLAVATGDDVRGAVVAGNLPLHLAALAAEVVAVEFTGAPPRGAEYDMAEMVAAGASLERYRVWTSAALADLATSIADDVVGNGGPEWLARCVRAELSA